MTQLQQASCMNCKRKRVNDNIKLDSFGIVQRVLGYAMGWTAWVLFAVGARLFSVLRRRLALGPTQLPIQWVPVALSPGIKRQGREANHL
jgi:hypothetical protein